MSSDAKYDLDTILENQRKCYNDATKLLFSSLNDIIDKQNSLIHDLKASLEFSQGETSDLKNEMKTIKSDLRDFKKKTEDQEVQINYLQNKLNSLEDHSRRQNIRVEGFEEASDENKEKLQYKIENLLKNKLQLPQVKISNIHRVTASNNQRRSSPRTILARLMNEGDRDLTMRNTWRLRGSGIYIAEDVCENSARVRKEKLPELKAARESGKIAYFSRSKLIIKNRNPRTNANNETENNGKTPPRQKKSSVISKEEHPQNEPSENLSSSAAASNAEDGQKKPKRSSRNTSNLKNQS